MRTNHTKRNPKSAFSLVEVLAILTVIAVMVAITVPKFTGIKNQARDNSAKRNAQIVASAAEEAKIAGSAEIRDAQNADEILSLLDQGVVGEGLFEGVVFKVRLDETQRSSILPYLQFENGSLIYSNEDVD